ncbi:ATP-binding protein [Sulfurimonas paralvinellae]|uniref:sensor histidine kinase n=1 Tax=Sulfurimonas paralvinellae TaxID=317658 RepID=UPI001865BB75|nr:ATP-binding protein [Sulfurimonas paralvinellae]
MLKFHQIVLRKFLTLFVLLFAIVGGIVYYWTYEFYIQSTKNALVEDTKLLSLQINNTTDFDKLVKLVRKNLNLRMTVVRDDGTILAESDKDKKTMDNHRYRDEIVQARENGIGFKIRHSNTVNKDLLYVARKIVLDDKIIYLRLAKEAEGIQAEILYLGLKILAVIILFFIAVFMASYKLNTEIQYETNKIVDFLKSLVKQKKSTYISSEYSQEFAYITKLLTKIAQIIVKKEKKKSKYTEKLQLANSQKDDIISAISHEFKNPIAVVNGYSQTLLDDENINPNIRKKFLEKIHKNGTKLSALIDTLRLSIKLDSKQQKITKTEVNLFDLVSDCVDTIKPNYHNRETIIEGDKDLRIAVDEGLFDIVLCNLIENAYKYSEDEVHIRITPDSLEIIDSGVGIKPKDIDKITEKFYRANTNKWNNSLGLGLFLANNIIKLHNFTLEIESEINKGSVFRVKF